MRRYYTDAEITKRLKELNIVCDTREQENAWITGYFDKKGIPRFSRKLDIGDYSATIGDYTLERDVVIERKADLDELAGNITADRERLEREFIRARANGVKVFLLVEDASWADIFLGNYRSRLKPNSFIATLLAWQVRYNLTIIFCRKSETAQLIHGILYYAAREALKNGDNLL
jgi:ERCC4-type nuclease